MHVLFTRQFNKDLDKLSDKKLAQRIEKIIDSVTDAKGIAEIQNIRS